MPRVEVGTKEGEGGKRRGRGARGGGGPRGGGGGRVVGYAVRELKAELFSEVMSMLR
jgi:hypothetical protein